MHLLGLDPTVPSKDCLATYTICKGLLMTCTKCKAFTEPDQCIKLRK